MVYHILLIVHQLVDICVVFNLSVIMNHHYSYYCCSERCVQVSVQTSVSVCVGSMSGSSIDGLHDECVSHFAELPGFFISPYFLKWS